MIKVEDGAQDPALGLVVGELAVEVTLVPVEKMLLKIVHKPEMGAGAMRGFWAKRFISAVEPARGRPATKCRVEGDFHFIFEAVTLGLGAKYMPGIYKGAGPASEPSTVPGFV